MDTKSIQRYHGRCGQGTRGAENNFGRLTTFLWKSFKVIILVWDMISILGSSKKIMSGPTRLQNVTYDNETSQQQQQNQPGVDKIETGTPAAATSMIYILSIRELEYFCESNKFVKERLQKYGSN